MTNHKLDVFATLKKPIGSQDMLIKYIVTHLAKLVLLLAALTLSSGAYAQVALNLIPGWNLAGNSLTTPIDVKTTFGTQANIRTVWKWDAVGVKWVFYAPSLDTAGTLASYATSKGYSLLTTINPGEGFWVNALAPVFLGTQSGTGFSLTASNLASNWNLAATADDIAPGTLTTNVGNVTTLWAWDNANNAWYFYAPTLAANNTLASYITSKNYKDFGTLTLGKGLGFWINYAKVPITSYSISGTLSGAVAQNVTITLSGTNTGSTMTDASGNYSFSGLVNGSYTVTPSPAGYTFSPTNRAIAISGANVTAVNFGVGGGSIGSTGSIVTLAKVPGGGATAATLSNGRVYFTDYNNGRLHSVSVDGGEIVTHYLSTGSPGNIVHLANQIFVLNTETAGILQSLPDTSVGITTLSGSRNISSNPEDIATDGTYVYWSEFDYGGAWSSQVLRTPLVPTASSPVNISSGASTDKLITFPLQGIARIALEVNQLFVSEGVTGNVYKVDLSTGGVSTLASALSTGTLNKLPLAVTGGYLYAVVNGATIVQINKSSGGQTTVASGVIIDSKIKSDGNGVYWWEQQQTNLVLRSLTSQTGQITNIVTIPATTIYDFYAEGGNVWWFDSSSSGNVSVNKVAVSGGSAVTVATFDPTLGTNNGMVPRAIAADATNLYWLGQINAILTLPKTGGTPAVVTREVNSTMSAITLTSSHIVWGETYGGRYGGVRKIPKAGQNTPGTVWQVPFPSMPKHMTADATSLYWIEENFNPTSTSVSSMAVADGIVQNLGTLNGNGTRLFPYIDTLFIVKNTGSGYVISAMPRIGGAEVNVVTSNAPIDDLYVIGGILYFISYDVYAYNLNTLTRL